MLPPIPTENLTASDVDELTRFTRDKMLSTLTRLTESKSGQHAVLANPPPGPVEPFFIGKPSDRPVEQQIREGGAETSEATGGASATQGDGNAARRR